MSKDIFNGRDPFDRFDDHFDRILNMQEKVVAHPVRSALVVISIWLVAFIIVCAVIAFFVSLFI
jgi:hypothetical protein